MKRRESREVVFDRIMDGKTFHHTGDEVLLEDGKWHYEYWCPDTDEVIYG